MKFIQDDEFILIIEDQLGRKYSQDDKKRLYDAGIRTMIHYPFWRDVEPELGVYDWSDVDKWIEEDRQAGLKTMLSVYQHPPAYFPDDWYLKRLNGSRYTFSDDYIDYERVISPWSEEGWEYHLGFIARFCERNNAPDVLCFSGVMQGGSAMLPEVLDYRADGDLHHAVIKMASGEQCIFVQHPSHEIWTALHPHFDKIEQSGTGYRKDIYDMLAGVFPEAVHYGLTYTFFGPISGAEITLGEIRERHLPMWTGSEYVEGLRTNTDKAIDLGFRGFVCAPLHTLTGHHILEDWMLDTIRESLSKWRRAHEVHSG